MSRSLKKKTRKFGGKLFVEGDRHDPKTGAAVRREANIEKKHLQAYLKGHKFFRYGVREVIENGILVKKPAMYAVNERWV